MPLNRRDFAALLGVGMLSLPPARGGEKGDTVIRATNQGASIMEQNLLGGSTMVTMCRRPMRLPFPIRRSRVYIPVFTVVTVKTGNYAYPTDQFFPERRSYQRAINPVFSTDLKDTPDRLLYMFGGVPTFTYEPATWDRRQPGIFSDWLEHEEIPADTDFEWAGAVRASPGKVPVTAVLFGDIQTTSGFVASSDDIMGSNGLARQRDFSAPAPSPRGSAFYDNAILLADAPSGTPGVVSIGDSNLYAFGYDRGDDHAIAGPITRGFVNGHRVPHLNIGRGSDGDFALGSGVEHGMLRRLMLQVLHKEGEFTHRIHAHGSNDVTKTLPVSTWKSATDYAALDHVTSMGGQYICTKAGRSSSSDALRDSGRNIADGSCEWAWIEGLTGSGRDQQTGACVANEVRSNAWLRQALPGVPAFVMTIPPHTRSSTDEWTSGAGQVVSPGWGDASSRRGRIDALRRGLFDLYGYAGVLDINRYVEDGYPAIETGKWRTDGKPKTFTVDGVHMSEQGAIEGSRAIDALKL